MVVPSEPHDRLLNRHLGAAQNPEYVETLDRAFSLLLNEATWLFSRCWEASRKDLADNIILILLRHILEMADAIHILLLSAASRPAQLQLRSLFEGLLYVEFILEEDTETRAAAYATGSRLWSLGYSRRLAEGSATRAQLLKEIESDPLVSDEMVESWSVSGDRIEAAEAALKIEPYATAAERFSSFKSRPHWYRTVEGGPSNLRDLSIRLNRGGQYIMFDIWSRTVHPDLLGPQLERNAEGEYDRLRTFRDGDKMSTVAHMTSRLTREALEACLSRFRAEELGAFRKRFAGEINLHFAQLGDTDVIHLD